MIRPGMRDKEAQRGAEAGFLDLLPKMFLLDIFKSGLDSRHKVSVTCLFLTVKRKPHFLT